MIFHENRLLADDSHEISYLIFFFKLGKMSQNLSSAAVVIDTLRVKVPVSTLNLKVIFHRTNIFTRISILNISTLRLSDYQTPYCCRPNVPHSHFLK